MSLNTEYACRFTLLIKASLLLAVVLSLSGCGGMFSNQARCPFSDKGGCQSVSDVNKMVSEGKYTDGGRFVQQAGQQNTSSQSASSSASVPWAAEGSTATVSSGGWNTSTPYSGEPLRTQEVDGRLWVAPWQDHAGAFHGASYITFVVSTPHWQPSTVKAITNTDSSDEG